MSVNGSLLDFRPQATNGIGDVDLTPDNRVDVFATAIAQL
jgi:hypothetical protein